MKSIKAKIGGKEREFSLSSRALGNVVLHFDNDIHKYIELLRTNGFLSAIPTLYYTHEHFCKRNDIEIDFTLDNVEDWVDELEGKFHNKEVQKVLNQFIVSLESYVPKTEKGDSKKK